MHVLYGGRKMVYCCSYCRYVFERDEAQTSCPDCGKKFIRHATGKEIEEYIQFQREFYPEKDLRATSLAG